MLPTIFFQVWYIYIYMYLSIYIYVQGIYICLSVILSILHQPCDTYQRMQFLMALISPFQGRPWGVHIFFLRGGEANSIERVKSSFFLNNICFRNQRLFGKFLVKRKENLNDKIRRSFFFFFLSKMWVFKQLDSRSKYEIYMTKQS